MSSRDSVMTPRRLAEAGRYRTPTHLSSRVDDELFDALFSSLDIERVLQSTYPLLLKRVGADRGALGISLSGRPEDYRWIAHELPAAFFDAYPEMAPHDFVLKSVSRQPYVVLRDQDMVSRAELEANLMYRHAREVGAPVEQVMAVMLHDDGWQSLLSLYRAVPRPFSMRERKELQRWTPAIINAVRHCYEAWDRSDLYDALEVSLDEQDMAIMLVTSPAAKVEQTAAAARLIEEWFDPHERREGRLPEPLRAVLAAVEGVSPWRHPPWPWKKPRGDSTLEVSFVPLLGRTRQWKWRLKLQVVSHAIAVPTLWREKLTPREREVASGVLRGWDNLLISEQLGLGLSTVKAHVVSIFDKLNVSSRAALVVRGVDLNREELVSVARLKGVAAQLGSVQRDLHSLLDAMPLGVCAVGPDGIIVVWNRALERLTGITARAATNKPASALPEPWGSLLVLDGPPLDGEQWSVSVLGQVHSFRVHRTPLDGAFLGARPVKARRDGVPERTDESIGTLYLLEDQTEKVALAERLSQAERLAALGTMSAVLAHEIKNPLAALKGFAQLLVEALPEGTRPRTQADRVVEQAVRLQTLIESLLDFVRSGQIARASIDPADLVRTAAEGAAPNASLDLAAAPPAWSLDGVRMRQVLENLLRNAEQASPGAVQVIVGIEGAELVITVRDAGPGFAAGEEQKIFEPFHTTKTQGVGLGLTVARRVVEMHGGVIAARNRPEGGAELRVAIPVASEEKELPRGAIPTDRLYDRASAQALRDRTLARLDALTRPDKRALFEALRERIALSDVDDAILDEIAAPLGMKRNAVKVALFRLRERFFQLVRQEVADTLEGAQDVDAELRDLQAAWKESA